MKEYSEEFKKAMAVVEGLVAKLDSARNDLQAVCPHVTLQGKSTFPGGISFVNCRLCGVSSRDV